jgi:FAD/FMN-containing dehydrogenase
VGVGTIHIGESSTLDSGDGRTALSSIAGPGDARTARLMADIKAHFDPAGRLNPGRSAF